MFSVALLPRLLQAPAPVPVSCINVRTRNVNLLNVPKLTLRANYVLIVLLSASYFSNISRVYPPSLGS